MATSNILVVDPEEKLRVLVHEVGDLKSVMRLLEKRVAQLEDRLPDAWSGDAKNRDGRSENARYDEPIVNGTSGALSVADNRAAELLPPLDLASIEKLHILRVLQYTGGNKVEAARLLNIGLTTVYRKMEAYGLG